MNYPFYNYQNYQQYQPQTDDRLWVQGEESARAYLVAPNSFVRLWDSQEKVFYEKRADASGRPFMETYEYTLKTPSVAQEPTSSTADDKKIIEKLKALESRISALEKEASYDAESDADDSTV